MRTDQTPVAIAVMMRNTIQTGDTDHQHHDCAGAEGCLGSAPKLKRCAVSPPAVMERINEATQTIGTMIKEVSKDVFLADPSGEALSGAAQ